MRPVVTPEEMAAIDAASSIPVEVLIERAGASVARAAVALMGGTYGRRVTVVVGKGNNGRDGEVAARRLSRRGVAVDVVPAGSLERVAGADLVIDAAYGTGFRGSYVAPDVGAAPVLAVDIPSGVDGLTGASSGRPARAVKTVTFAALKPGLLFADGAAAAGSVAVADIGLDLPRPERCGLVEATDITRWVRLRPADAHKWKAAVWVVGGTPEMPGAPVLAGRGAFAAGAGYVRVSSPGAPAVRVAPLEAVSVGLPLVGWDRVVLADVERVAAVVVGPGLGRSAAARDAVCALATRADRPMVIDGDGLWAIADLRGRMADAPRVLTPHDGEYTQLAGHPPGGDRISAARRLAAERSAVVLLKGPTTVVAEPRGAVRLVTSGDQRLATAGSGDVLSGVIGALLASGVDAFDAAASAAFVHGLAGSRGPVVGTTAGSLPTAVSLVLSDLVGRS